MLEKMVAGLVASLLVALVVYAFKIRQLYLVK
jgi:hypothetical protein